MGSKVDNVGKKTPFSDQKKGDKPFPLSRSKIESFCKCNRCFYLHNRCRIIPPSGYPFTLNIAVDNNLKFEFDHYRALEKPHPYFHDIEALDGVVPAPVNAWREFQKGVRYVHPDTNFEVHGIIDDLWMRGNEYIVADYKATSSDKEVDLNKDWQISYKRQMEIYQWLLRRNGLLVSDQAWFVYANGKKRSEPSPTAFDGKLDFNVTLLPYEGSDAWIEPILFQIRECLDVPIDIC